LEERIMSTNDPGNMKETNGKATSTSSSVDEMLLAALERGGDSLETGRYLITYKEGAAAEGLQTLEAFGMRIADARDFADQAVVFESVGDADVVSFPEIGVALLGGDAARERSLSAQVADSSDTLIESIDPEVFVFADQYLQGFSTQTETAANEYLRGFLRASELIANDLRLGSAVQPAPAEEEEVLALGATWGLRACRVPTSTRSGAGIKVAILDTGLDLGHPDFAGRPIVSQQFVGQPVQDLHSHGTHCTGTACGIKTPPGVTPRYGIGHRASIFIGKVLSNSGSSVAGSVLNGINWAIANRCAVISMSLGSPVGPQPFYTAAGQSALNNGLLIVAAAGNNAAFTNAPANSPTIFAVASLDSTLSPSSFSCFGKIEIAAPGRDVFSSVPRPTRYGTKSGTSMATPHVAGCAALWAETSPNMRGMNLWNRLRTAARPLPFPASRVGAGLVQAP
jgi:subtilisin